MIFEGGFPPYNLRLTMKLVESQLLISYWMNEQLSKKKILRILLGFALINTFIML